MRSVTFHIITASVERIIFRLLFSPIKGKKEHRFLSFLKKGEVGTLQPHATDQSRKTFWVLELKEIQYVRLTTSYLRNIRRYPREERLV